MLTYDDARLFHHFTRHLGRWLDCTNASRIFTLRASERVFDSPVLANAVKCFSARHLGEFEAAEEAYERCITLLIDRLSMDSDSYEECLLSAVLLLHFADQLKCKTLSLSHPIPIPIPSFLSLARSLSLFPVLSSSSSIPHRSKCV